MFALMREIEIEHRLLMMYLPADGSFIGAQVRPWTLEMIESRTESGTNYEVAQQ